MRYTLKVITMAILIALCIPCTSKALSTDVAQIGKKTYGSVYEAIQDAKEGDIVEIIKDSSETKVIPIDKGVTINGNGHTVVSNSLKGTEALFLLNTSAETIINNITIEANTRGIAINNSVHHLTIDSSTLNVGQRGITVNTDKNHDSVLNINDCTIQNKNVANYDEEVPNDGSRGISLWQYADSTISMKNTTIQGFSYVINITSDTVYDSTNTKLLLEHCILKGRAGINDSLTTGLEIEMKDSKIIGINNQAGKQEAFGDIVIFSEATVKLALENTKLLNYQNEVGMENPNALQYMLDIRTGGNIIRMTGNTFGTDTTNKLNSIFRLSGIPDTDDRINDIEITGGTYDYDVSDYVPSDYTVVKKAGKYVVGKKAKTILMKEKLELVVGEEADLGVTILPFDTIQTERYTSSNSDILEVSQTGKIIAKKPGTASIIVSIGNVREICQVVINEKDIQFTLPEINLETTDLSIGILKEDKININKILMDSIKNSAIEEKKKEGEEISIAFQFDTLESKAVQDDVKDKIEKMLTNEKIMQYFDISVLVSADGSKIGRLTELAENIKISIKVPKELQQQNRKFYIFRLHNGEVEKLDTELEDTLLTFNTNKFSIYALAYVDVNEENEKNDSEENNSGEIIEDITQTPSIEDSSNIKEDTIDTTDKKEVFGPQTGDIKIVVFLFLASLASIGLIMLRNKKKLKY